MIALGLLLLSLPAHAGGEARREADELANHGVSPWVVNYLHTLRVVGNEVVHIRERSARTPEELEAQDLAVCLFCLLRVARFWLQTLEDRPR